VPAFEKYLGIKRDAEDLRRFPLQLVERNNHPPGSILPAARASWYQWRSSPNYLGESIGKRSFDPLSCSTRITMRSEEFAAHLKCGRFEHGFLRVGCRMVQAPS
jgi:hypothetical protein